MACCICSPDCPAGFSDIGVSCKKPDSYMTDSFYDESNNELYFSFSDISLAIEADITVKIDGVTDLKNAKLTGSATGVLMSGLIGLGLTP